MYLECKTCRRKRKPNSFGKTAAGNRRKSCVDCNRAQQAKSQRNRRAKRSAEAKRAERMRAGKVVKAATTLETRESLPDGPDYAAVTAGKVTLTEWAELVAAMLDQAKMGKVTAANWIADRVGDIAAAVEQERRQARPDGPKRKRAVREIADEIRRRNPDAARMLGLELLKDAAGD